MATTSERIRSRCVADGECLVWTGAKHPFGYGVISVGGRQVRAHRALYEAEVGPIPIGLLALHRCDRPDCVNPEHIFLGTQQDNIDDMIAKGRYNGGAKPGPPLCPQGHDDWHTLPNGKRRCRPCWAAYMRGYKRQRRHASPK